jgi:hypothetical protein
MSDAMSKGMEMALGALFKVLGINREEILAAMEQVKSVALSVDERLKRIEEAHADTNDQVRKNTTAITISLHWLGEYQRRALGIVPGELTEKEDQQHVNGQP